MHEISGMNIKKDIKLQLCKHYASAVGGAVDVKIVSNIGKKNSFWRNKIRTNSHFTSRFILLEAEILGKLFEQNPTLSRVGKTSDFNLSSLKISLTLQEL